jgi:hypothetical protein
MTHAHNPEERRLLTLRPPGDADPRVLRVAFLRQLERCCYEITRSVPWTECGEREETPGTVEPPAGQ